LSRRATAIALTAALAAASCSRRERVTPSPPSAASAPSAPSPLALSTAAPEAAAPALPALRSDPAIAPLEVEGFADAVVSIPQATTSAPPAAKRIAIARPIPVVPVTSATFPAKSFIEDKSSLAFKNP